MSKTFDQGREEIAKLCRYFANNRMDFFALGVKEAHVRQSLIDPFFEALGWDMRNAAMTALQYREVVPEDSLEIEGQQKAPDYTFRVGTLAKFYTEAKKCGININADPGPAYQLRRYGWSAKVPLSILTDFEELGVYDCSLRPRPADKASFGRIQYFKSEEYPDRWRELWDIFSREAVWAGAYDRFAVSKRKRGTSEVDSEFLKEIEGWRDALARNIALRNLYLGYDDLNTAVQRTIDRLIFLRMAEDRGSEAYGQLLKLCERPGIYARFVSDLCRKADEKYNSGLFHFQKEEGVSEQPDSFTPALTIDDKVIKPILQSLYFENGSPYHFGVLPVEILGTVYERFLGKVIRLTPEHRAKVEEKPEVRKAGGVYYTPAYIVDYIVKNTVGKMIEGKSPAQLAGGKNAQPLRVLDMACGSGSFLLGAYQCLLDHCLKWYFENHPEKHKEAVYFDARRKFWRLTITEKKRILTTHIFGVDIDLQAVEVSKLSLLLKVLEGETDETVGQSRQLFHERALPNLSNNIKCGNSLIGPDYFSGRLIPDPDEMQRVNPFDWQREFPEAMKAGGFDCVIGNPPYGALLKDNEKDFFRKKYESCNYKFDSYIYFIEKSLKLVKPFGFVSFITPEVWLKLESTSSLRKLISDKSGFSKIRICGENVFENAVVNTIIFLLQREKDVEKLILETEDEKWEINTDTWKKAKNYSIEYRIKSNTNELLQKIILQSKPLSNFGEVIQGITAYDKYQGQDQLVIKNRAYHSNRKINKSYEKWLNGKDISRYSVNWSGEWISYGPWLAAPRDPRFFTGKRILFREIPGKNKRIQAAFVEKEKLFHGHSITPFKANPDCQVDLMYILGIVNSILLSWQGRLVLPNFGKNIFPKLNPQDINLLPIRNIDLYNKKDKLFHDQVVLLGKSMQSLICQKNSVKTQNELEIIQRQIDSTDHEIDRLVYELYGLTEKEIKIIEDETAK